jgi:hypothetical protein
MEHALDTDVLVDIRPVDTLSRTDETEVCTLLRCGVRETPRPGQGNADNSTVCKPSHDLILCDLRVLNPRLDVSRHSVHAMPPESVIDER